jgi:hypothetical protein
MAPRAYCKGRLKLSLVFCATKLHPATSSERVRFPPSHHEHRGCAEARPPSRGRSASGAAKVYCAAIAARAPANRCAAWRLTDLAQSRQMLCVTARRQAI